MAPAPFFYIGADERVLQRLRAAPSYALALAAPALLVLAALLAAALTARALAPALAAVPAWQVVLPWGALVALVAIVSWRRAATTEYVLTDERIYARTGRLVTRVHFTTHDKVTDIRYHQGPLSRLLGLAGITFATAGGEVRVLGIRDALALKAASEAARDAFIRALLAHSPGGARVGLAWEAPEPQPAARPVAPAWTGPRPDFIERDDTPVWSARPRPIAAAGALRSVLGLIPVLLFSNALDGARRALVLVAALGLVLLFIATRLMQLRRTEYVATDRRVYGRRGLIGTTVAQLTYDKITDITYTQDLLGRVFGYGTLTVQTAGSNHAPITMVGLAEPLVAKETIERWRDASTGARG